MNFKRIFAIVIRHLFLLKRDLARIAEIVWYPIIDLTIWGLVTSFLSYQSELPEQAFLFFVGGMILWVFVYRMQMSLSISLMIDMWDRNFLNLFVSPLTTIEYMVGLTLVALLKLFLTFIILTLLALFFYAFDVTILGFYLIPFILSLMMMGWWMGTIINGFLLRFGFKIEAFAWALVYVFNPLSGVFYPLEVMPSWMRNVALFLPSSYIFEGMRQVLLEGFMDIDGLFISLALNIVYSIVALIIYYLLFRSTLRSGMLVKLSD